ncbi:MAG: hypothetical protein KDN22_18780 [Verrucomicrobiae bacterium]|nr:hypothetical protein [Verrucomicrobiae bacterium]
MMRSQLYSLICGALMASLLLLAIYGTSHRQQPVPTVKQRVDPPAINDQESRRARRELVAGYRASSEDARARLTFLDSLNAMQVTTLLRAQPMPGADQLGSQPHLNEPFMALFERLMELDFDAAFTFAETEIPAGLRLEFLEIALLQWAVEDPDTCQDWIDRSNDQMEQDAPDQWKGFLRKHAELRVSCEATDQEIARQWSGLFSAEKIDGASYSAPLGTVFTFENKPVARLDPILQEAERNNSWQSSAERMLTIPDPNWTVIPPVVKAWRDRDLQSALDWVESLPAGKIRDDVIVWGIANIDKVDGNLDFGKLFAWLVRVSPATAYSKVETWAEHDPDAAARWILENDVPPDRDQRLRHQSRRA